MRIDEWYRYPAPLLDKKEVGIEVEMEGGKLPKLVGYWSVDHDPSLRGASAEYVLKTPCDRKLVDNRLDRLWKAFTDEQAALEPSDRCGVHIHINCRPLSPDELWRFIVTYYAVENLLMRWCGDDREGNLFCMRAQDAEYVIRTLLKDRLEVGMPDAVTGGNKYRYASMNLAALTKYGSLEFRGLSTPATPDRIKQFAKLVLAVKDYALAVPEITEIIANCSRLGSLGFVEDVFRQHKRLFADIAPEDIERLVMDGVRIAQAIAFTPAKEVAPRKVIERPKLEWDPNAFMEHAIRRQREMERNARNDAPVAAPPPVDPEPDPEPDFDNEDDAL